MRQQVTDHLLKEIARASSLSMEQLLMDPHPNCRCVPTGITSSKK